MEHSIDKVNKPPQPNTPGEIQEKRRELAVFLFLAIVLFPILSVIIVAGYGFIVWMTQVFFTGPPGPPG
ncbi:MAG TPA: periplasmic nitrate reductase, NapE protein [Candidatus Halomonas stercoripullorum]|uniref:Periplasmic nitrate reductase, NapE protein n=1 Tax=Candidatus Halomonas stercoripullorum TaxID=2838617 RepID=A0A9D1WMN2_9GAMM|nr:periplasmic nitrate reductase, NapE protein [Candidatus Halomonas stercoripullorum]